MRSLIADLYRWCYSSTTDWQMNISNSYFCWMQTSVLCSNVFSTSC